MLVNIDDVLTPIEDNLIEPLYISLSRYCESDVWDYICFALHMNHMNRVANIISIKSIENI